MKKLELEIKILDIDKIKLIKKLEKLGAKKIDTINEKMYVYDLPGINSRFYDILEHLNFYGQKLKENSHKARLKKKYSENSEIKYKTALDRLYLLFKEINYLLTEKDKEKLATITGYKNLLDLCSTKNILEIINTICFKRFINKFFLNPNKWMRLRKVNDKNEITIKHILPGKDKLQQIEETEINASNFEETNELLEAIGFHYKNYFEKERIKYSFDGFEIDIDTWPGIPTYCEIEGSSLEELDSILKKIGYSVKDGVSCTANEIFKRYGKSMFEKRELKFEVIK